MLHKRYNNAWHDNRGVQWILYATSKKIVTTTSQPNTANDNDDTLPPCGVITRFTWLQNTLYVDDDTVATLATKCVTNQHQNINITWTCTLGAIFGKQHKTAEPEMHGLLCAWFSNIRLLCTNCHLLRQTNEKRTIDANNTTAAVAITSSFTWQWWHQIDNIIVCCTMGVPVMGILTRNNIIFINNTIILVVNKQTKILRHNLLDVQLDTWTRSRTRNPTIYANCFFLPTLHICIFTMQPASFHWTT